MTFEKLLAKVGGWKTVRKILVWAIVVALGWAFVEFTKVNFITTYESLVAMFGASAWVLSLSVGVVAADIAALARVLTPQTGDEEPAIIGYLMGLWFVVSMFDASLTWYFTALEMEQTAVRVPAVAEDMLGFFPVIVSLLVWGVHFSLLFIFGKMLEHAIWGNRKPAARPVNRPSMGGSHARKAQQTPFVGGNTPTQKMPF